MNELVGLLVNAPYSSSSPGGVHTGLERFVDCLARGNTDLGPALAFNGYRGVQNSRFLILPWCKVHGLASHVLGLAAKRVGEDWSAAFHVTPVMLETFVEMDRFKGICYKAANWQCLGTTTGRGKKGANNAKIGIKSVWVYPLTRHFRKILCQ